MADSGQLASGQPASDSPLPTVLVPTFACSIAIRVRPLPLPDTVENGSPMVEVLQSSSVSTPTSPQPEISPSGRDESNPEVQEEREMPVSLEDPNTSTVNSTPPNERTTEPQDFTAEAEPRNDSILEDARKIESSTSCCYNLNRARASGLSYPPSVISSRRRYSSWPGSCQESYKNVEVQNVEEESQQEIFLDNTEQLINGKSLELREESLLAERVQKNKNESIVAIGKAEHPFSRGGRQECSSEEVTSLKLLADASVEAEEGESRPTTSHHLSVSVDSSSCDSRLESYTMEGEKFHAATPVMDCSTMPATCTDSRKPKIATRYQDNVRFFQQFYSLGSYGALRDPILLARNEAVRNIDFGNIKKIGEGGNGEIYEDCKKMFAIKKGPYREKELNIFYSLNHPNIIPLLGVTLIDSPHCYQVMPRMTCDLYKAYESFRYEGLVKHLCKLTDLESCLIILNVVHIFKYVARGLEYLNDKKLYHGDITARNILLDIRCECRDGRNDIFCCKCINNKYSVVIADFDSIYSLESGDPHSNIMGTKGFRAPEVCLKHNGWGLCQCCPKSDIYSLGAIMIWMLYGTNTVQEVRKEANIAIRNPKDIGELTVASEGVFLKLLQLDLALTDCKEDIRFLIQLASLCLKVTVGDRPSAGEFLEKLNSGKL